MYGEVVLSRERKNSARRNGSFQSNDKILSRLLWDIVGSRLAVTQDAVHLEDIARSSDTFVNTAAKEPVEVCEVTFSDYSTYAISTRIKGAQNSRVARLFKLHLTV